MTEFMLWKWKDYDDFKAPKLEYLRKKIDFKNLDNSQVGRWPSSSGWELGDGLGSLDNGVLGEFSWEEESDGSLDFSGGESMSSAVSDESAGFGLDSLGEIVDEWVHDAHRSSWDTGLLVNLSEDSEDVDGEGLGSSSSSGGGSGSGSWSWSGGGTWSSWHFNFWICFVKFGANWAGF